MQNQNPNQPQTRTDVIAQITADSQSRGYVEFPKMLHGPNGKQRTVTSPDEEKSALQSGEWHPTPNDALAHQTKVDKREEEALQRELNEKKRRQIEQENQRALDEANASGGHGPISTTGATGNIANVAQREADKKGGK